MKARTVKQAAVEVQQRQSLLAAVLRRSFCMRMMTSFWSACSLHALTFYIATPQGLAIGFVLLRVESLAEEGKL